MTDHGFKPSIYSDDVLVEVKRSYHDPWEKAYLHSVFSEETDHGYICRCWIHKNKASELNFDPINTVCFKHLRPIKQK